MAGAGGARATGRGRGQPKAKAKAKAKANGGGRADGKGTGKNEKNDKNGKGKAKGEDKDKGKGKDGHVQSPPKWETYTQRVRFELPPAHAGGGQWHPRTHLPQWTYKQRNQWAWNTSATRRWQLGGRNR